MGGPAEEGSDIERSWRTVKTGADALQALLELQENSFRNRVHPPDSCGLLSRGTGPASSRTEHRKGRHGKPETPFQIGEDAGAARCRIRGGHATIIVTVPGSSAPCQWRAEQPLAGFRGQNLTRSPPFSRRRSRASVGVATSSERSSTMRRILETWSALLSASCPLPR